MKYMIKEAPSYENALNKVPKGFHELEGATTAPKGTKWFTNNESWFGGKKRFALVKETAVMKDIARVKRKRG